MMGSSSINLAQFEHNHIPFENPFLSSSLKVESYRGPPGAAAVIWHAIPILVTLLSPFGPCV